MWKGLSDIGRTILSLSWVWIVPDPVIGEDFGEHPGLFLDRSSEVFGLLAEPLYVHEQALGLV